MKYYDFKIAGKRVGYFELEETSSEIYMNARFVIDGESYENPFWVRVRDGQPTHVRSREADWEPVDPEVYPTAAFPIFLRAGVTKYHALIEGTGESEEREIREEGGVLVEYSGTIAVRKFRKDDDEIMWIRWGGNAESMLCESKEEAVKDSPYDDVN